jgi:hypothetical protein
MEGISEAYTLTHLHGYIFPNLPTNLQDYLTGENLSDMIVSCAVLCTNAKIHTPLRARYSFQLDKTSASS